MAVWQLGGKKRGMVEEERGGRGGGKDVSSFITTPATVVPDGGEWKRVTKERSAGSLRAEPALLGIFLPGARPLL